MLNTDLTSWRYRCEKTTIHDILSGSDSSSDDLDVSMKDASGQWTKAMGGGIEINSPFLAHCPFIDFITSTFYFTGSRPATITEKTNLGESAKIAGGILNGMGNIYFTALKNAGIHLIHYLFTISFNPHMTQPLVVTNSIIINAPIEAVWDALVNPDKTRIYMYGCEAISDWIQGSPLLWMGEYEGKKMAFVKGRIEDIHPPFLLRYSVFDPNSTMEDIPENYLHVTCRLEEENGKTTLTVTQDGFEKAARGEERYLEVYNHGDGWNPILQAIANLLENP